jgi:glycosyltransferase involved in cell wall biosynthesis
MLDKIVYKVTIVITTYNLVKYIEKALDSVLNQKTNFKYKILIGDDNSQDGTLEILKSYQLKYPEKIYVISSDVNKGSLFNSSRLFDGIKTDYISFLDGDDYWINENRLQMQVDFMDQNLEYSMCGANTLILDEDKMQKRIIDIDTKKDEYDFNDYLNGNAFFVHTSSILIRNSLYSKGVDKNYFEAVGKFYECAYRGEDVRFLDHLKEGKVKVFLGQDFSVYRIHNNGIWQGSSEIKRNIESIISYYIFQNRYLNENNFYFYDLCKKQYENFLNLLKKSYTDDFKLIKFNEMKLFLEFYNHVVLNDKAFIDYIKLNLLDNTHQLKEKNEKKVKFKYKILIFVFNKIKKLLIRKKLLNEYDIV